MTIQEAIKSGKKIKRPIHAKYTRLIERLKDKGLNVADILANDWEVEEEKFEVTQAEIAKMVGELRFHSTEEFDKQIIEKLFEGEFKKEQKLFEVSEAELLSMIYDGTPRTAAAKVEKLKRGEYK